MRGLEIVLRLCVLIDDQSVANVARSVTVGSDGFRRATEPLVEHFLHRMTFRPQVVDLAALAMVVGSARGCAPSPDSTAPERGHHIDDVTGNRLVTVRENRKRVHASCGGTVSHQSSLEPQLSNIALSMS